MRTISGSPPTRPASSFGGSLGEKPRLGKYPKISGSHAPQMKISSTIMMKSLPRGEEDMREDLEWKTRCDKHAPTRPCPLTSSQCATK